MLKVKLIVDGTSILNEAIQILGISAVHASNTIRDWRENPAKLL